MAQMLCFRMTRWQYNCLFLSGVSFCGLDGMHMDTSDITRVMLMPMINATEALSRRLLFNRAIRKMGDEEQGDGGGRKRDKQTSIRRTHKQP